MSRNNRLMKMADMSMSVIVKAVIILLIVVIILILLSNWTRLFQNSAASCEAKGGYCVDSISSCYETIGPYDCSGSGQPVCCIPEG